jgi:LmbE family N-acetylglucosaminyl deacetylase
LLQLGSRALVLGAHIDDEFGCAGTVARLVEAGLEVHLAAFSPATESVPQEFPPDALTREAIDAIRVLGIPPDRFRYYDFPVRHFPEHRQEILELLVVLRQEIEPDLVLVPATGDIHQDHGVMASETLRAFKHTTVLGYEMPMNTVTFEHSCFVRLEERHMEAKLAHAAAYRSQAFRPYFAPEAIRALATIRGLQINQPAAEAFEVIRMAII